jgi:hypothetical protein
MVDIKVDSVVRTLEFEVNAQPSMREQIVRLAVESCPDGGTLELEQSVEGLSTVRVKVTKPEA